MTSSQQASKNLYEHGRHLAKTLFRFAIQADAITLDTSRHNWTMTVTDSTGRTTTFGYVNGLVRTITDFAGGVSTLAHEAGTKRLLSITHPDPDDFISSGGSNGARAASATT